MLGIRCGPAGGMSQSTCLKPKGFGLSQPRVRFKQGQNQVNECRCCRSGYCSLKLFRSRIEGRFIGPRCPLPLLPTSLALCFPPPLPGLHDPHFEGRMVICVYFLKFQDWQVQITG